MAATAGYIRVSSRQQRDETDSPANQRRLLEQAGATVFFEDLAVSGFKPEQRRKAEGFRDLVAAIEAGEISRLLCTRLDRVARRDGIVLELAELCDRHGVEFVSLGSGQVDVSTVSGWLSVKMALLMGEHFSRQLSENIAAGYRGAWARGKPARGPLPWHLQRDPEVPAHEHKLIPSPAWDDAKVAVRMFLRGEPTMAVANFLRERGHIGSRTGLLNWLRNPLLVGHAGAWRQEGVIRAEGVAPALVTAEEFSEIQARIADNRKAWGANSPAAGGTAIMPLSGVCTCEGCGRGLAQNRSGQRKRPDGGRGRPFWSLRCPNEACPHFGRSWSMRQVELAMAELLKPEAERIATAMIEEREARRARRAPSADELKLRAELAARERMPVEFRTSADADRIAEIRQLLGALRSAAATPRPRGLLPPKPMQIAVYRVAWARGTWIAGEIDGSGEFDPPWLDADRNRTWKLLTDLVVVNIPARSVAITWRW